MGQQTLYALLGLIVATSFSFTVLERHAHLQRQAITREVEEMAGSVAVEVMEVIRGRAFDRTTAPGGGAKGTTADLGLFDYNGSADHFSKAFTCYDNGNKRWLVNKCDDIDDFDDLNGADPAVIPFAMGEDEVVYFQIDVEVEYVSVETGTDGKKIFERHNGPTFYKRVTVKVQDKWGDKVGMYVPTPVELSRVMTYDFASPS